jgi:hypothetical protein
MLFTHRDVLKIKSFNASVGLRRILGQSEVCHQAWKQFLSPKLTV